VNGSYLIPEMIEVEVEVAELPEMREVDEQSGL
jgi:hypothetical protein